MHFSIIHSTQYVFDSEVFPEPHYFRFRPMESPRLKLNSFNLALTPTPKGLIAYTDAENNHIHLAWFEGLTQELIIEAQLEVKTRKVNPFDFIIFPVSYQQLPYTYTPELKRLLSPFLQTIEISEPLRELGQRLLTLEKGQVISFISALIEFIHTNFISEKRHMGPPHPPSHTFITQKGSCRDLSWMLIHLLRHLGLASRFVSGYRFLDDATGESELHAWTEVFIPGAGWLGIDPSYGLFVNEYYIPLATSAYPENTMPVTGTIRGSSSSRLYTKLAITRL